VNRVPPTVLRRLVLAPLVVVSCLAVLAVSPMLLLAGALMALIFDRRARALRITAFFVVYLFFEIVSIVAMFGLWLGSGAGLRMRSPRIQAAHFAYMRWWLERIQTSARRLFRLSIEIDDPPARKPGPVLVFSRHAGPGNSLLLLATLMIGYERFPRIVMLAKIQWDPFFDMIGNRLPNRFISHNPSERDRSLEAIAELAGGTRGQGAFVLFPEGRDFTSKLRVRAIAHLRKRGYDKLADRAERMRRVLPPRHGGVMAAVNAAPDADVVFVAHTVLEHLGPFRELWRRIPFERPVSAKYWRIPADDVPREKDALIEWLYEWWDRIDQWINDKIEPEVRAKLASADSAAGPVSDEAVEASTADSPDASDGTEGRSEQQSVAAATSERVDEG
jgi:hypothetical protein